MIRRDAAARRKTPPRRLRGAILLAGLVGSSLVGLGCGPAKPSASAGGDAEVVIYTLSNFYGEYLNTHGGVPPKDEADFRAFLAEKTPQIDRANVGGVDELLKSPRDGQPWVVIYGKKLTSKEGAPWAAYEQTGADGKRWAAQVRGEIKELTAEEFAKQFPQAGVR